MGGLFEPQQVVLKSKRKWFWISILVSGPLAGFTGFVLGIALLFEARQQKNGWLLIAWSIVWNIVVFFATLWLVQSGFIPQFRAIFPVP